MSKEAREYKDNLFRFIFGRDEKDSKEAALSLYNALNNTSYTDLSKVEVIKASGGESASG